MWSYWKKKNKTILAQNFSHQLISSAPMWNRMSVDVNPTVTPSISRVQGSGTRVTRCRHAGKKTNTIEHLLVVLPYGPYTLGNGRRDANKWRENAHFSCTHLARRECAYKILWANKGWGSFCHAEGERTESLINCLGNSLCKDLHSFKLGIDLTCFNVWPEHGPCWGLAGWTEAVGRWGDGGCLSGTARRPADSQCWVEGWESVKKNGAGMRGF